MIKLENTEVLGWEAAIRGMRNPMNSWEKSDSWFCEGFDTAANRVCHSITIPYAIMEETESEGVLDVRWAKDADGNDEFVEQIDDYPQNLKFSCEAYIGPKDHKLMTNLAKAGSVDAKYRRMIVVTVDITAPLYWWKEFDTYKVGTVANSCSTMHKIHSKEFTLEDFSCEHLLKLGNPEEIPHIAIGAGRSTIEHEIARLSPTALLDITVAMLNRARDMFLETKEKKYWWQMIQLLPSSYNQRRTVMLNYEVLAGIYPKRKDHKLDEWQEFCKWIEELPYSEIITVKGEEI